MKGPTGERSRIIQFHPTRRCNLRCLHCYSASGPEQREETDPDLLRAALHDAAAEGYTVASFSGGEPLLYPPLRSLLELAQSLGMVTAVVSNGMLLDERRLATLAGVTNLLAISLDGVPTSHNRMRANPRAFETMLARLDGVRGTQIPFGFLFTLTQFNLHELAWVAQFALEQGARLLQIHPLEEVGRAGSLLPGARPDHMESAFAYLEMVRLQASVGARLTIQLDLADRAAVAAEASRVFAQMPSPDPADMVLAELISPLVVETDGTIVPLQHGLARAYALGNLNQAPLSDLARTWRKDGYLEFHGLCRRVFETVTADDGLPFFNWYEVIGNMSHTSEMAHVSQAG